MNVEVTEESLLEAATRYKEIFKEEPLTLNVVLRNGNIFRKEGLDPMYIMVDNTYIFVTSIQSFEKKLH